MTRSPTPPPPAEERQAAFLTLLDGDRAVHTLSFSLPAQLAARLVRCHDLTDGLLERVIRLEDEHALSVLLEQRIDSMLPETEGEVLDLLKESDAAATLARAVGIDPPARPEEVEALLHSDAAEAAFSQLSAELAVDLEREGYDPSTARPIEGRVLAFRRAQARPGGGRTAG